MSSKLLLFLIILFAGCAPTLEYNPITGKERLALLSTEQEIKLGRMIAKQIPRQFKIVKDPNLRNWVNKIGYKLTSVCDRKDIVYYFNVIESKEEKERQPNAFALPGGYVYVTKSLLDLISNDDELAGVLAHEISHVVLRHSVFKLQESIGYTTLLAILSSRVPGVTTAGRIQNAISLLLLSYGKEKEFEADRLGVKYLKKAGYKVSGMISILEKIQEWTFKAPIRRYYLHTHPYIDERIKTIKIEAKNFNPKFSPSAYH
jgi:predicted Zn-dependent protease